MPKSLRVMKRPRVVGAILLVALCLLAILLWVNQPDASGPNERETEHARTTSTSQREVASDLETASGEEPTRSRAEADPSLLRRAFLERAIADAREARLAHERTETRARTGGSESPGAAPGGDDVGALDPDYIRSRIQELRPLLAECYALALSEQTDLRGKLVVEFVIAGEPDVGGIVEESHIDEVASTLAHPTLTECVRETMYTAEFTAPEGGGRVTVRYPFDFSNDEGEK